MIVGKRQAEKHTTPTNPIQSQGRIQAQLDVSITSINLFVCLTSCSYLSPAGGIINSILAHLIASETAEETEFYFLILAPNDSQKIVVQRLYA